MRILMISDVYFPRVNGVSTSIQSFRKELIAMGHQVTLIAPSYPTSSDDDQDVIRIPSRYVMFDPEDRMLKRGAIMALVDDLKSQQFDLIHIQTPFVAHYAGLALAKQLQIPVVATYHTFFEEYLYNYIPFLPKAMLRYVARHFSASQCNDMDAVIVPSRPIAERLKEYGVSTPIKRLPTGIEMDEFNEGDGARFRRQQGIDPQRPTMLYVGRVAHEKNIGFLLRVAQQVKLQVDDVLFIIAGEGTALASLKKQAAQLGLADNVQFVGYLSREQVLQDCYCAGNAFVFASRTETQGLVLLEAMALGVPVVSTAVLGTKDVLQEGCGALIAEEGVTDFAGKVIQVLQNTELQQQMAVQGRAYAEQWQAGACAERMVEFYQALLTK